MDNSSNGNGWSKYEQFVLRKLEDIEQQIRHGNESHEDSHLRIYRKLSTHENELTKLKTKFAVWGIVGLAIAGAVGPAVAAYLIK